MRRRGCHVVFPGNSEIWECPKKGIMGEYWERDSPKTSYHHRYFLILEESRCVLRVSRHKSNKQPKWYDWENMPIIQFPIIWFRPPTNHKCQVSRISLPMILDSSCLRDQFSSFSFTMLERTCQWFCTVHACCPPERTITILSRGPVFCNPVFCCLLSFCCLPLFFFYYYYYYYYLLLVLLFFFFKYKLFFPSS